MSRTVLVVEDDADLNEMVGAYVQMAGFEYKSAVTGGDALVQAQRERFALILLDLMLPDVDGMEVCRVLKSRSENVGTPVVILSALDRTELRQTSSNLGAVDYVTKPFDPDQLMRTIRRHARNGAPR